jgi:hypothetical protein
MVQTTTRYVGNREVTCISNIDNTPAMKKRQAITGEKQKASTAHSSDHHDADGLAGHKH